MSSIQLSGISGISSDALQTRYQKALKQINKLIDINRQLKENSAKYEQNNENVRIQIEGLRQQNSELINENGILQNKYMQLENHYRQLDDYCKKLQEQLQRCRSMNEEITQKLEHYQKTIYLQAQTHNQKYNSLAQEAESLRQTYEQNLIIIDTEQKQKHQLKKENQELKATLIRLQEANSKLVVDSKQSHLQQLKIKIAQLTAYNSKLLAQCTELKNKQLNQEAQQQKQKMHQYIAGSNLIGIDIKQNQVVKGLIIEYKKKIKALEADKKQLQQKFKILVHQSKSPSKDNYTKKIECLQKLTEKQQTQIARIIQTYDRQINGILRDNTKLKETYNALFTKWKQTTNQITEKQKLINQLQNKIKTVSYPHDNSIKAPSNQVSDREGKIKQLQEIKNMALSPIKQLEKVSQPKQEQKKVKSNQIPKDIPNSSITRKQPSLPTPNHKIPITVRYGNNEAQDNFKFIQNVNIINGFNLSLNSHSQV